LSSDTIRREEELQKLTKRVITISNILGELTKEVNSINKITQDLLQKEIKDLQELNEFAKTYEEENKQVA
jgi:uncharacterized protein YoxC|tara:strand:- start:140 stop:349 length:210 start_codon:yes stop_codon:yes gene_type:complete